jgi:hypothetical protein
MKQTRQSSGERTKERQGKEIESESESRKANLSTPRIKQLYQKQQRINKSASIHRKQSK